MFDNVKRMFFIICIMMPFMATSDIHAVQNGEMKLVDGNQNVTVYNLEKDKDLYRITVIKNNVRKEIYVVNGDLIPVQTTVLTGNEMLYSIDYLYRANGFDLVINYKNSKQFKRLASSIILEPEALWFTLYDMIEGKNEFKAMAYDFKNKRILEEYYKYIGYETVNTPDGKVECHKIEMGLTGFFSVFWPYKYHYYFSKSPDHRFVAYRGINPKGDEEYLYAKY